jgi:ferredoxin
MLRRKVIAIDGSLCTGCGACQTGCAEGALQVVDGKAWLVREKTCDGFGECIGARPTGALKIEERECEDSDIQATVRHPLKTRGEEAVRRLEEANRRHAQTARPAAPCGCPGLTMQVSELSTTSASPSATAPPSAPCRLVSRHVSGCADWSESGMLWHAATSNDSDAES